MWRVVRERVESGERNVWRVARERVEICERSVEICERTCGEW